MTGGRWTAICASVLCCANLALAGAIEFDFKDPKGVNAMTFELDSPLEPIFGTAAGISGKISFDPAKPEETRGTLVVDARSLNTTQPRMTEVLHSADWLDVAKHPTIEFKIKEVRDVRTAVRNTAVMTLVGDFTCHGVTKEITVEAVAAHYLEGKLENRIRGKKGDLLVLRADFTIRRTDFGIKPDQDPMIVDDQIRIRTALVGWAER